MEEFDVSGLREEHFRGSTWYIDKDGTCLGRICTECRLPRGRDDFYKAPARKYGIGNKCSSCERSEAKGRYRESSGLTVLPTAEDVRSVEDMLGTPGLSPVYMQMRNGFRGIYYINNTDECVAKTCSQCKDTLPVRLFNRVKSRHRGLSNMCKDCNKGYSKEYGDSPADDGKGTRRAEGLRQYYRLNSARSNEQILIDRADRHPDDTKLCVNCRVVRNLNRFSANRCASDGLRNLCKLCEANRDRDRRIGAHIRYWEAEGIPEECYISGDTGDIHIDHVIPSALGGSDESCNRLPLRADLNLSKGKKPLLEWMMGREDIKDPDAIIQKLLSYGVNPYV